MNLIVHDELTQGLIQDIESFLLKNNSVFNPLFSSPLWAERLKKLLDFKYEFLIIREMNEIVALHLIFRGYRGYVKIGKLPIPFKHLAVLYAKSFFGYIIWYNFIVFKDELDDNVKEKMKELIYTHINSKKIKIQNSPIYNSDEYFFKNICIANWGTYILDTIHKTYDGIYGSFKRQARKSIEKTIEKGICVKTLSIEDIENYTQWLIENQIETNKFYKIDSESMKNEFEIFNRSGYIYEIFVAYQDNIILGSLGIWGFGDFISEFGVQQSRFAKENKLYIQDVIKDSIVKFMCTNNIKYYDLSGFNPNVNSSQKEQAIKQFKFKFSAEEFLYKTIIKV